MKILIISDYRDTVSARSEVAFIIGVHHCPGVEVEVMTYPDCELAEEFQKAGIEVTACHPVKKWDRDAAALIRKRLQEGQHDILHLFNSKACCTGVKAARGLPVRIVLYRGYVGNVHWWNPGDYLKFLHPRIDAIMCLVSAVEDDLQKQSVFVKPKLRTINKGHDPAWYEDVTPLDRTELGVSPNEFFLVTVANARRMKGTPYLIEALRLMPPEIPIKLLLVGQGLDRAAIQKQIRRGPDAERLRSRLHFTGHRKDVLRIVKSADAFVLPSIFGEAITKSAIEAMSLGIAPIITDIPGNRELLHHGESGLVVPAKNPKALAEAVQRYIREPDLRKSCGTTARERIRTRFHPEQTVTGLLAFYGDLLKDKPGSPAIAAVLS